MSYLIRKFQPSVIKEVTNYFRECVLDPAYAGLIHHILETVNVGETIKPVSVDLANGTLKHTEYVFNGIPSLATASSSSALDYDPSRVIVHFRGKPIELFNLKTMKYHYTIKGNKLTFILKNDIPVTINLSSDTVDLFEVCHLGWVLDHASAWTTCNPYFDQSLTRLQTLWDTVDNWTAFHAKNTGRKLGRLFALMSDYYSGSENVPAGMWDIDNLPGEVIAKNFDIVVKCHPKDYVRMDNRYYDCLASAGYYLPVTEEEVFNILVSGPSDVPSYYACKKIEKPNNFLQSRVLL